ncbi:MAG: site-specific integrase [Chamaesiphon sp.]|nr:site-specific integrase [Chamaesiphon sp.]
MRQDLPTQIFTNPPSPLSSVEAQKLWLEFLQLKISPNTQHTYAKAIADFYQRIYSCSVSPQALGRFLALAQNEAVYQVCYYRSLLIAAKLAPSTINTRLSALKSLVKYAHQLGQCNFNLSDVTGLKVDGYRDTAGIAPQGFHDIISLPLRATVKGSRDYAILRLLWDNALKRGEISNLNVEDFVIVGKASAASEASMKEENPVWKLTIVGNRKIQHNLIALAPPTTSAIVDWLDLRGNCQPLDPLFISLDHRSKGHRLDGSSIYRLVRKFSEAAGIDKVVSPHQVRHSAITAYLDASERNVRGAQGLSRLTNLNILSRYEDNRQQYQEQASNILADLV